MSKTILIVEDNELNMKLFNDLLEAHGYMTVQARNDGRADTSACRNASARGNRSARRHGGPDRSSGYRSPGRNCRSDRGAHRSADPGPGPNRRAGAYRRAD